MSSSWTTDAEQDDMLRRFFLGCGITISMAHTKKHDGYWHYSGQYRGYDIVCRAASKLMTYGHRIIWAEMIWNARIFYVVGLDSLNKFEPTAVHKENMEIGLARMVYNK